MKDSSHWVPVQEQGCYGVAKYGFGGDSDPRSHYLRVNLGETLRIHTESTDWFYASKTEVEDDYGIIPKSYVHIQECNVLHQGETEIIIPKWPPLVQEITDVLKEWHKLAKCLYLDHDPVFNMIRVNILNLHSYRRTLLCPNWTVEGLRQLKKQVAQAIDAGNSLLKLDMSVRDENGNPLNPSVTSAIQLFRQHKRSSERLEKAAVPEAGVPSSPKHHSQSLLVTCERIQWRVLDELEVRFFLYDGDDFRPFSEGAQTVVKAGTGFNGFRFLFTDLGKRDEERNKILLVAYVVRIGPMEFREEPTKTNLTPFAQKRTISNSNQQIRRPWGVAAKDITKLFRMQEPVTPTRAEAGEPTFVPFMQFGEHESLKLTLTKLLATPEGANKDILDKGFSCNLSLISGTPAEIMEEQPLLLRGNPVVVRKMGFPEVILPNDVRNDLYITLMCGEFHKSSKASDRNVEVTVTVHNENGDIIKGILFGGSGSVGCDEYKSVVYYHEDKPKWEETFKISLPMFIDQFSSAHVKFTFKHRSSSENKDKQKPFALAYVKLRLEKGTALSDSQHNLLVYKIDMKQYKEKDVQYLNLPSMLTGGISSKRQCLGLSWATKDSFHIRTTLCSTKFTQNLALLDLLQWSTTLKSIAEKNAPSAVANEEFRKTLSELLIQALQKTLTNVTDVIGEEIVKFLPDVFDALFSILVEPVESIMMELGLASESISMDYPESEACDRQVFDCLVYIFGLILDHKYQNFRSVLSHYIEEGFSATMAYTKLIKELQNAIKIPILGRDKVVKIMKSLEFFIKFIVRSFHIRLKLMEIGPGDDLVYEEAYFDECLGNLFSSIGTLLATKAPDLITVQAQALKHIPAVIEPLTKSARNHAGSRMYSTTFSERRLSEKLVELLVRVEIPELTKQKLLTIMDIVKSSLFRNHECRTTLLPVVANNIQNHLPGNDEDLKRRSQEHAKNRSREKVGKRFGNEVIENLPVVLLPETSTHSENTQKCVDLLSEVMDILYRTDIGPTLPDISYVMHILLRPIIYSIGTIGDNDPMAGNMVAILMSLLRQMPATLYTKFMLVLKNDGSSNELLKFLNDALVVFKTVFSKCFFPCNWSEMILLQNSILLGALEHFAETIKKEFADPFEEMIWNNFFQCGVAFLTQDSLQLENFSRVKQATILSQYQDMRLRAAELIRQMWFSLGESKRIRFVPYMVGTFLDMALVPEPTLRRNTIPIFFDMMRCSYDQVRDGVRRGSFQDVEDELIKRLVESIEGGKGDPGFRDIFQDTMICSCEKDSIGLREPGLRMVVTITRLLDLLLEYREVIDEADSGNRMTCIVNLLDFSKEFGRNELYLRYLYKLHDLHIQDNNFTEAAFTLKLHSRQLQWTEEETPEFLKSPKHGNITSQMELKEILYKDIIHHFDNDNAKMWECAIEICDELRQQYSEEMYNYSQLPKLLTQMAQLYDKILNQVRFEPEYFRVAFYGRGFPSFLQDKVFIYRGRRSEKLNDFEARMLERFPHAESLRSLNQPSLEQRNSSSQLLQICKVDPVMNTSKRLSGMKYAEESIRRYYQSNDVSRFVYSRPYHKEPKDPKNEFASLWLDRYTLWTDYSFPGIMSWFPVISDSCVQVSPIKMGIETLEETNEKLRSLVLAHCANPNEDFGTLSLKLNGVLDAAVMGGISNYEKAFFTPEYLEKEPGDAENVRKLKGLILAQVPIVSECLRLHREKVPENLRPLHQKLELRYQEFVTHLEEAYGVNVRELKDEGLQRDMDRAQKKRLALARKDEQRRELVVTTRNSDHGRSGAAVLSRSKSSFSSTLSVYSALSANKTAKSMMSIGRPPITHRRSTQGSMDDTPSLGRNGMFMGGSSMSKLSSIIGETETELNRSRDQSTSSLIPLAQSKASRENRKSLPWSNGDARSSGISVSSTQSMSPGEVSSSRNSVDSRDDQLDEELLSAPPLPPKLRDTPPTPSPKDNQAQDTPDGLPVLPPKKPPLRIPNP